MYGCVDWTGSGVGERSPSGIMLEAVEGFLWDLGAVGCEGHLLGWGHAQHSPAPTVQLPPWPSLLAPPGLFEAGTTRGCAEAGC